MKPQSIGKIQLNPKQRILVRTLHYNGDTNSMAIVGICEGNIVISPCKTETANTIFIDGSLTLVTPTDQPPFLEPYPKATI